MPGFVDYGSAKAGLNQMAKNVANEEAPNGIRANVLCPGVVLTEIHTKGSKDPKA